jgi:hypothetical protein
MNSEIFLLRSYDRQTGTSANFRIKPQSQVSGRYEVLYIQMFNTFYSVNTGINDIIYFNENATDKTATIPAGYYTTSGSTSILTAIGTAMTTASGGFATFTAAMGASSQFITITSTQNFSLKFGTSTTASAAKTLGYASSDTSAATTATATNVPALSGPASVNIIVNESRCYNYYNGAGNYGNILVPIDVSFGALKYYKRDDFRQYVYFETPQSVLNIRLTDTNGSNLSLNGSEFEVALRPCSADHY